MLRRHCGGGDGGGAGQNWSLSITSVAPLLDDPLSFPGENCNVWKALWVLQSISSTLPIPSQ
jgi:hypothetical protein